MLTRLPAAHREPTPGRGDRYSLASALIFGPLFFPTQDFSLGLIANFGSYFLGFAVRPVGGIIFGLVGDRLGCERRERAERPPHDCGSINGTFRDARALGTVRNCLV